MAAKPPNEERQLQRTIDAERFLLGAVLLDGASAPEIGKSLEVKDFTLESHRRIFAAVLELQGRGVIVDRITIAEELARVGQLESVGGLTYLVDLDAGLPAKFNTRPYIDIVREHSRRRQLIAASQKIMAEATAGEEFSEELVKKAQAALLAIASSLDREGQVVGDFIDQFPGGVNALLQPWLGEKGIRTGFNKLDEWTDGFHESEIFVIGARPGVGKSSIGLNICEKIARDGYFCAFFSLEMSKKTCVNRLICSIARVDSIRFRLGYLNPDERTRLQRALSIVNSLPIFVDDSSGLTVPDISMRLQALMQKQPVSLCVIDYFQLLRGNKGQRHNTENDMFTHIAHDLQLLSKRTGVPLLILSQLNRESEKGAQGSRPRLSQCRGAGAIEEIANVGGVIYREELTKRDRDDLRGKAELLIEKNRGGPSGTIDLVYLGYLTKFENRADDMPDEPAADEASA